MAGWYFFLERGRAQGPYRHEDVCEAIRSRRLGPFDLVYREGERKWGPLVDHIDFKEALAEICGDASADDEMWVVLRVQGKSVHAYKNFAQEGPFSTDEVQLKLKSGELLYQDYVWKEGMDRWQQISSLHKFNPPHEKVEFDAFDPVSVELPKTPVEEDRFEELQRSSAIDESMPEEAEGPNLLGPEADLGVGYPSQEEEEYQEKQGKVALTDVSESDMEEVSASSSQKWSRHLVRAAIFSVIVFAAALFLILSTRPEAVEEGSVVEASASAPQAQSKEVEQVSVPDKKPAPSKPKAAPPEPSRVQAQKKPEPKPESKKKPAPTPRKAPTYLKIFPSKLASSKGRLVFRTDASFHYPIRVFLTAEAGEILDWNGYHREVTVRAKDGETPVLEVKHLGIPDGSYRLSAKIDDVEAQSRRIFIGRKDAEFFQQMKEHKKRLATWQQKEKRQLFAAAKKAEKAAQEFEKISRSKVQSASVWRSAYKNWRRQLRGAKAQLRSVSSKQRAASVLYPIAWMDLFKALQDLEDQAEQLNRQIPLQGSGGRFSAGYVKRMSGLKRRMAYLSLYAD